MMITRKTAMNRRHPVLCRVWILVLGLITASGAWAAGPWYVATNGADTGNDGLSWSQPFASISNAIISYAASNDIINVSNGVYTLAETVSNVSTKACKIIAASTNPVDTVLLGPGTNGWPSWSGVYMAGVGSTLEGFTVTNFCLAGENVSGAGVYCSQGTVSNCIITGNTLTNSVNGFGAGLYVIGNGVVDNCLITGNNIIHLASPGNGGGGAFLSQGWIRNCRILDNRATSKGAGVFMSGETAFLLDSIVASNTSPISGGVHLRSGIVSNCLVISNYSDTYSAICLDGSWGANFRTCRVEKCVVTLNRTRSWGTIYVAASSNSIISHCVITNNTCFQTGSGGLFAGPANKNLVIRNCLVANNWGEFQYPGYGSAWPTGGAGICVSASNALIENCTIVSNQVGTLATAQGAGLYVSNEVRVVNSIIYYNRNDGDASSNYYATADCTFSNTCAAPLPAVGSANIDTDPQFVARETDNYHLSNPSPCVNAGMNQDWMTNAVDLDEKTRVRYGIVDMGTYERIYSGTIYNFR